MTNVIYVQDCCHLHYLPFFSILVSKEREGDTMISVKNLVKRYGDLVALDHLNLDIREGEIFGLLGPNGSGKTTAINCILALLKYSKGSKKAQWRFEKKVEYRLWHRTQTQVAHLG